MSCPCCAEPVTLAKSSPVHPLPSRTNPFRLAGFMQSAYKAACSCTLPHLRMSCICHQSCTCQQLVCNGQGLVLLRSGISTVDCCCAFSAWSKRQKGFTWLPKWCMAKRQVDLWHLSFVVILLICCNVRCTEQHIRVHVTCQLFQP